MPWPIFQPMLKDEGDLLEKQNDVSTSQSMGSEDNTVGTNVSIESCSVARKLVHAGNHLNEPLIVSERGQTVTTISHEEGNWSAFSTGDDHDSLPAFENLANETELALAELVENRESSDVESVGLEQIESIWIQFGDSEGRESSDKQKLNLQRDESKLCATVQSTAEKVCRRTCAARIHIEPNLRCGSGSQEDLLINRICTRPYDSEERGNIVEGKRPNFGVQSATKRIQSKRKTRIGLTSQKDQLEVFSMHDIIDEDPGHDEVTSLAEKFPFNIILKSDLIVGNLNACCDGILRLCRSLVNRLLLLLTIAISCLFFQNGEGEYVVFNEEGETENSLSQEAGLATSDAESSNESFQDETPGFDKPMMPQKQKVMGSSNQVFETSIAQLEICQPDKERFCQGYSNVTRSILAGHTRILGWGRLYPPISLQHVSCRENSSDKSMPVHEEFTSCMVATGTRCIAGAISLLTDQEENQGILKYSDKTCGSGPRGKRIVACSGKSGAYVSLLTYGTISVLLHNMGRSPVNYNCFNGRFCMVAVMLRICYNCGISKLSMVVSKQREMWSDQNCLLETTEYRRFLNGKLHFHHLHTAHSMHFKSEVHCGSLIKRFLNLDIKLNLSIIYLAAILRFTIDVRSSFMKFRTMLIEEEGCVYQHFELKHSGIFEAVLISRKVEFFERCQFIKKYSEMLDEAFAGENFGLGDLANCCWRVLRGVREAITVVNISKDGDMKLFERHQNMKMERIQVMESKSINKSEGREGIVSHASGKILLFETGVKLDYKIEDLTTNLDKLVFQLTYSVVNALTDTGNISSKLEEKEQYSNLEQEHFSKEPEENKDKPCEHGLNENCKVSNDDDLKLKKSAEEKTFTIALLFFNSPFHHLSSNDEMRMCRSSVIPTEVYEEFVSMKNMQPPNVCSMGSMRDNLVRRLTFASIGLRSSWFSADAIADAGFYVMHDNTITCYSCQIQHNIRDINGLAPENPQLHYSGCEAIKRSRFSIRRLPDVESDGRVSDDVGDAPGQQWIYIPPGDARREDYRLATFEKFPVSCAVSRNSLSRLGFYFIGLFDRVKCFACGRTVERWEATDNPAEPRWHKPSCPLLRGEECGNVPIMNLFSFVPAPRQAREEQRDTETGALIRRIRFPANLPERIRSGGDALESSLTNPVHIRSGLGSTHNRQPSAQRLPPSIHPPAPSASTQSRHRPMRPWRMANVVLDDNRRFLNNLYLNRELDRLASFSRCPVERPPVFFAGAAKHGFFYLGDGDRTQCFSCGGVLTGWGPSDRPAVKHREHFPNCKFVLGEETRNVPIPLHSESAEQREQNFPCRFPANPHMRSEDARLETFDHRWSLGRTAATPLEMVRAGFFSLGDSAKCWYCNGVVHHWGNESMPWTEHAKWFPNCQFLLRMMGQRSVYRQLFNSSRLNRQIISRQDGATIDLDNPDAVNVRPPSPPPLIIDPQEEIRKKEERIENAIKSSEIIRIVLLMGFPKEIVRSVLKEKVDSETEENPVDIYGTVFGLLVDVQKKEEEQRWEELSASRNAPTSSSLVPRGSGKYNAFYYGPDEVVDLDMYNCEPTSDRRSVDRVTSSNQVEEVETLESCQEKLDRIEKEERCKICLCNRADMVFVPCGHLYCCMECTWGIRICLFCGVKIEKAIRVYLS